MHTCYACGYPMDEWEGDIDGNPAHKDCIDDMVAEHYHLWIFPDNGTPYPTAAFRRAARYKTREQAMRQAGKEGLSRKHDCFVRKCDCRAGVKGIVPKSIEGTKGDTYDKSLNWIPKY